MTCICGLGESTEACCEPIVKGNEKAKTAEALMRARYSAYSMGEIDFLIDSLHPESTDDVDRNSTEAWSRKSTWLGLEIVETKDGGEDDETGMVEFIARYEMNGLRQEHHERAEFKRHEGAWRYLDGEQVTHAPVVRDGPRIGRNDPCTCGSGKKYKKCCGKAA